MVKLQGFVSSCNKEFHGSGAGWLIGWYTEVRDLKLRKTAELNEVSSLQRGALSSHKREAAGKFGDQRFEPWLLRSRLQRQ